MLEAVNNALEAALPVVRLRANPRNSSKNLFLKNKEEVTVVEQQGSRPPVGGGAQAGWPAEWSNRWACSTRPQRETKWLPFIHFSNLRTVGLRSFQIL